MPKRTHCPTLKKFITKQGKLLILLKLTLLDTSLSNFLFDEMGSVCVKHLSYILKF